MKKIKIVGIVIGIIVFVLVGLYFGFKIDNVNVVGSEIYSEKDIEDSIFTKEYLNNEIILWLYNKFTDINKFPFVEEMEISYDSRNTVTIRVYDKVISGCIKYMGQYVYFDKDGIVLQSLSEHRKGVPIVTGIKFGDFTMGKAFDVDDDTLFDIIMNVSQLIGHYNISVKRIHVNDGAVTLYSGKVKVYLGKKEMYDDQLAALSSVLDTTKKKKLKGVIDMENYQSGDKIILKTDS